MADPTLDHAAHDLEAIAARLDDPASRTGADLADDARCPECAGLLADLRLLATAVSTLPAPTRTRDFRLDASQAARLGELPATPLASGRLGWDMTTPSPDHASHDPELVAAHLGGRLTAGDQGRVDSWLAECGACVELHRDLEDLAAATRALPTPARPVDYSLAPEDAGAPGPGGWRRLVAASARRATRSVGRSRSA